VTDAAGNSKDRGVRVLEKPSASTNFPMSGFNDITFLRWQVIWMPALFHTISTSFESQDSEYNTIYDVLKSRGWKETDVDTEWHIFWILGSNEGRGNAAMLMLGRLLQHKRTLQQTILC
jgi:hypothetical protein